MKVINANITHLQDIYAIECESFSTPWSVSIIKDIVEDTNMINYVALSSEAQTDKTTLTGYTFMLDGYEEGHIENIAVSPHYRGTGVGALLMNALIEEATKRGIPSITLEVRQGNRPAMALYHKYGFKVAGYRRNYYQDPSEDAIIMRRTI